MKVLIAPDSFKQSLSAPEVAASIAVGLQRAIAGVQTVCLPVADGGEGTTEALVHSTKGQLLSHTVMGPLGETMGALWGRIPAGDKIDGCAVIEVAAASGIDKISPSEGNALTATSRGTGELIAHALDQGVREFIVGLGGSACNDAGAGLLSALGVRLLDAEGQMLAEGGAALARLDCIDTSGLDPRLAQCCFRVACDVTNPLLGDQGASAIFGPQKGASPQQVQELDFALKQFADISEATTGKQDRLNPGAGAAGGVGFALMQYLPCEFGPGIELVLDTIDFASQLSEVDWVITGEGKLDEQSQYGKAPMGVAQLSNAAGVPVIAVAGSMTASPEQLQLMGVKAAFSVVEGPVDLPTALLNASQNLQQTAYNIGRLLAP